MAIKNVMNEYGLCSHLLTLINSKPNDGYSFDVVNYIDAEGEGNISGRVVGTLVIDEGKATYYATLYSNKGSLFYGICEINADRLNPVFSGWYLLHRFPIKPDESDIEEFIEGGE